ncbi:UvrB/UvrC motif-containing protein [Candidatus Omnitrophota bacterium]
MVCDLCKKRKSSVHLTEIVNDEVTELHLCEECAKAKGAEMQQHFSIADLLSGLVDFPMEPEHKKEHIKIRCKNCDMAYADFKKLGRFGCEHCYEAFRRALYPLLKSIHGTSRHIGKEPKSAPPKPTKSAKAKVVKKSEKQIIAELREELTQAIENEDFEKAAVLRDKIRMLARGK